MNHKKLRRLYTEERLQVRRRGGRKRALGTRAPLTLPQGPNQRWSLDFLSDAMTDGRRFRILAVVDDFTRECLCLVADTSLFRPVMTAATSDSSCPTEAGASSNLKPQNFTRNLPVT
jgi:transposase InsO family protein